MKQKQSLQFWHSCGIAFCCLAVTSPAQAQIVPDASLPNNSLVTPRGNTSIITGGTRAGRNLFHSFSEFSVPTNGIAHFNNAVDIQNIISRVTGGSVSNIDGLIRANGTANLFLVNPNGIIFGPNASLNIGGSFVASTANSWNFADGTQFSAKTPATNSLLTVSVPIGLQYGVSAGSITNQSTVVNSNNIPVGLQVQPGNTLALVGGDVSLNGGILTANSGRVELGGLTTAGTVGLNVDSNNLSLSFPQAVARSNVSLANGSLVDVAASGGGSIVVNAHNLNVLGKSILSAGIITGLGAVGTQAGDITLNATGAITVSGSNIFNSVESKAVGNAGNINITAGSLSLTNGAALIADTSGQGNAGSVFVQASDSVSLTNSSILSGVGSGAVGNSGEITLNARSLSLDNGTQLATSTLGQGNAGNIQVNATDSVFVRGRSFLQANTFAQGNAGSVTIAGRDGVVPVVEFDGTGASGLDSSAFTAVGQNSTGKGGDVNITARSLSLTNGAELTTGTLGKNLGQDAGNIRVNATDSVTVSGGSLLQSATFGQGNAGNVTIQAGDKVAFDGVRSDGGFSSGATTLVGSVPGAIGNRKGGGISITSQSLSLTNGAQLNASTRGQGDAGNVNINVLDAVTFAGVNKGFTSGAFSSVESGGVGKGGNVNVMTGSLSLTNGAQVSASTSGQGQAGNIQVNASNGSVNLSGVGSNSRQSSGLFTTTQTGANGRGGEITVNTHALRVQDGAVVNAQTLNPSDGGNVTINANTFAAANGGQVLTNTSSGGKAGNITLNVSDSVTLSGTNSGLFANTTRDSTGSGGSIIIDPSQLSLTNGAGVAVNSLGTGQGGSLNVQAGSITLDNGASLSAAANSSNGGNIALNVPSLLLMRHNSGISASAGVVSGSGNGGNITINTPFIVAVPSENSDITANAYTGKGGRVQISTQGVFGIQPQAQNLSQSYISASSQLGINGTVQINTLDINPTLGLVALPVVPVDVTGLIAQGCPADVGPRASKFVVTGHGGLPPTPREALGSEQPLADLGTPIQGGENHASAKEATNLTSPEPATIVEAQGWVTNTKGEVVLVAQAPTVTPYIPWLTPTTCHTSLGAVSTDEPRPSPPARLHR